MKRRMTLVGLAALCAVAFSAIAASGASAGVTAYTCVENQGIGKNTNEHCTPGSQGTGNYGHVEIPADETTEVTLTQVSNAILGANVFGAEVELIATGVECKGCSAHNHTDVNKVMEVTGSGGKLRFTGVEVGKVGENCKVTSDPGGVEGVIETEELDFTDNNSTTSVTLTPVAAAAPVLARFNIITAPGAHAKKCNLVGTHIVRGTATVTVHGSTIEAHIKKGEGLTLDEEPASLEGKATVKAGKNKEHHAIALTEA